MNTVHDLLEDIQEKSAEIEALVDRLIQNTEFVFKLEMKHRWWGHSYCLRVIDQYKKFLILAYLHKGDVVPPAAIDEVWHLHLTYTDSYWEELCPILGFRLHHRPAGGLGTREIQPSEPVNLENAYELTLKAYITTFRLSPPSDIWKTRKSWFSFTDGSSLGCGSFAPGSSSDALNGHSSTNSSDHSHLGSSHSGDSGHGSHSCGGGGGHSCGGGGCSGGH